MNESVGEKVWRWVERFNTVTGLWVLFGGAAAGFVLSWIAAFQDVTWKIVAPLLVIAGVLLFVWLLCLSLRPPKPTPEEIRQQYQLKQQKLDRVIRNLLRIADDYPIGLHGVVPISWKRWHSDASEALRQSVKPKKAAAFPVLMHEPNEEMITSMASTLQSIAANLTVDDLSE